jgi:hypothetical protein
MYGELKMLTKRLLAVVLLLSFTLATTAVNASSRKAPNQEICHFDSDLGLFKVITVNDNAVASHFARHGDTYPGVYYADLDGDGLGDALGAVDRCPNPGFVDNDLDACPLEAADTPNGCSLPSITLGSDLVTGNSTPGSRDNNVSLLRGDGAGGFSITNYSTQQWRDHSVAAGDIDGDGADDIVVVHYDGQIWVDWGSTSGIVLNHVANATGNPFQGVVAGFPILADFNNDGALDLAVKTFGNISVFLNNGVGSFGAEIKFPTVGEPRSIAAADLDGDGNLDIVAVGEAGSGGIAIHYGDGVGGFLGTVIGGGHVPSGNVQLVDINNDGTLDIVTGNWTGNILFYLNDGNRSYTPVALPVTEGGLNKVFIAADLDGDGDVDLVTAGSGSSSIQIWFNDGTGNFPVAPDSYTVGANPIAAVLGDFNEDGIADIATLNLWSNNISILTGIGSGIFNLAATVGPLPNGPGSMAVGNFD